MTISTSVIGYYHQSTCPSKGNNSDYECINKSIQLIYQCSNIACNVSQQNTSVRGCQEARLTAAKTFSCKRIS